MSTTAVMVGTCPTGDGRGGEGGGGGVGGRYLSLVFMEFMVVLLVMLLFMEEEEELFLDLDPLPLIEEEEATFLGPKSLDFNKVRCFKECW